MVKNDPLDGCVTMVQIKGWENTIINSKGRTRTADGLSPGFPHQKAISSPGSLS